MAGRTIRDKPTLYVKVSPGGMMNAAMMANRDLEWHNTMSGTVIELNDFTAETPVWELEVEAGGVRWLHAAQGAGGAIDKFVKKNYDSLIPCRAGATD